MLLYVKELLPPENPEEARKGSPLEPETEPGPAGSGVSDVGERMNLF